MTPRIRKPAVPPEKRREWLERLERGESPPRIAQADGFDARTVRKYLEQSKQEREVKEARASVLRSALERHYDDLCRSAQRLMETPVRRRERQAGDEDSEAASQYDAELITALRQHIPKSPVWRLLAQHAKLLSQMRDLAEAFKAKTETDVSSDLDLKRELGPEETAVIPGMVMAFRHQLEFWTKGYATLNVKDALKSAPVDDDLVELRYGAFGLGKVRKEHVKLIGEAITRWTSRLRESEELTQLARLTRELEGLEKQVKEEVAVIVLRRVVPGRCRYCPL